MTETFCLSRRLTDEEVAADWEIRWVDVVSMYPWIQLTKPFPEATHPEVFGYRALEKNGFQWGDLSDGGRALLESYAPGLAWVYIVPPSLEYYPVLPSRIKNRTMFSLCHACAERNE